eukprot:403373435
MIAVKSFIIFIAVAGCVVYYLVPFELETNIICRAQNDSIYPLKDLTQQNSQTTNVSQRFSLILQLIFIMYMIALVWGIFNLFCNHSLRYINRFFVIILVILSVILFVGSTWARFSHSGRVCSGDFLREETKTIIEFFSSKQDKIYFNYLIQRGELIWSIAVTGWITMAFAIVLIIMMVFFKDTLDRWLYG